MDERSPDELAWMVGAPLKVGANAGTAILIDQTFRDYREDLPQIDVPTLLAWGRDEKLVPVSAGEEMQRRIPDAELVFFEQSGHCPMYEEAEAFNAAVAAFAARLPG
jgi:pimeloyl-ACP methyl ester carboxylesterase